MSQVTKPRQTKTTWKDQVQTIGGPGSGISGYAIGKAYLSANPEVFYRLYDQAQRRFRSPEIKETGTQVLFVSHAFGGT